MKPSVTQRASSQNGWTEWSIGWMRKPRYGTGSKVASWTDEVIIAARVGRRWSGQLMACRRATRLAMRWALSMTSRLRGAAEAITRTSLPREG